MVHVPATEEIRAHKAELIARMFPGEAERLETVGTQLPGARPSTARVPVVGNVRGVGFGAKVTGGRRTADGAMRVYVRTKVPRHRLDPAELVPAEIAGLPTDVVAVGDVRTFDRSVRGGASIGHVDITAGTLGCLVATDDHPSLILSNNHVMADVNRAEVGDPILHPGPADGGTDPIAELIDFEEILVGGGDNLIDAAVARVLDPADVSAGVEEIGQVCGPPVEGALYQSVRKFGRTTLHTVGVIMDVSVDLWVQVLPGENAWFVDQFAVVGVGGDFSQPGDSGSLVVDAVSRAPVGLLFAGGLDHTFMNPIGPVLDRFGATVAVGSDEAEPDEGGPIADRT